jgi:hypothetical protein
VPDDPGDAVTTGDDAAEAGKPTRVNRRAAAPAKSQPESAITTAEIPRVTPAPSPQFPRGDGWHPDIERRLPAPWGLQAAVWVLFVLCVIGLVGLATEHFHPSWVAFLRNTTTATTANSGHRSTPPTSSSPGSSTSQPATGLGKLVLVSTTKSAETYSVPTSAKFSVAIYTTNRCYTLVKSPPASSTYLFAATITPQQSPVVIKLDGPASVVLDARASALAVKVGSKVIGSITPPQPLLTYIFTPAHR